jgi:hypothetical protein
MFDLASRTSAFKYPTAIFFVGCDLFGRTEGSPNSQDGCDLMNAAPWWERRHPADGPAVPSKGSNDLLSGAGVRRQPETSKRIE